MSCFISELDGDCILLTLSLRDPYTQDSDSPEIQSVNEPESRHSCFRFQPHNNTTVRIESSPLRAWSYFPDKLFCRRGGAIVLLPASSALFIWQLGTVHVDVDIAQQPGTARLKQQHHTHHTHRRVTRS